MTQMRLKKKVGQIYINIPGYGSFSMEAIPDHADNLNLALEAAKKEFWRVYKETHSEEP